MFRKMLLLTTALIIGYVDAYAQDEAQSAQSPEPAVSEAPVEGGAQNDGETVESPERKVLLDRIVDITTRLDKAQASHFFVMYSNYSMMSLVKNVEKDVSSAVDKCGEANPEMKDKVSSRFEEWQKNVHEAMVEADSNLENMSLAQDYLPQSEVKQIFAMIDKTRIDADTRFQRIPVSTPEACEFMLTKMDETQNTMSQLLRATLASYPAVLQKTQE